MMNTNNQQNHARQQAGFILALIILISAALMEGPNQLASAETVAGGWSYTGSLNTVRPGHSATLLPNGKVLVAGGNAGGCPGNGVLASAELYDPSTGTWSFTGSLNVPRVGHTATLLGNDKVLVGGGYANNQCRNSDLTNTAELYDPATGEWSFTGNTNVLRNGHAATLLPSGKLLFAGGAPTAELYDPATGKWSLTGNLIEAAVADNTATLLQDGKVLLLTGRCEDEECYALRAELYDPNTQTWSITGSPNPARWFHSSLTTLPNGNVLLLGDSVYDSTFNTAELYNPATGRWSYTGSLPIYHKNETVTLLPSGQVLVVGGGDSSEVLNSAELYNPHTGTWNTTARLNMARTAHTATLLSDGKVLVVGGHDRTFKEYLRSAELYDPEMLVPAPTAPRIILASVSGKKLFITGENFDDGAVILLNGEEQKSKNDQQYPGTYLIGKKAGKKIKAGDLIQVRNPGGAVSEEFIFTGSQTEH